MRGERFHTTFVDAVKARTNLVELIGAHVALKRAGREAIGPCPFHNEKTPSFTVSEDKGFYHCFGCGAHGSAIDFVMQTEGLSFPEAVKQLAARAGLLPAPEVAERSPKPPVARLDEAARAAEKQKLVTWARRLWAEAEPAVDTATHAYLRARGIVLPPPMSLRHHPALKHSDTGLVLPAMLAAVQDREGRITGIHRTFLKADGSGKAGVSNPKKMAGVCWGGAVRLTRPGRLLAVAEGIETALSIAQAIPNLTVWAALSLGNMAGAGAGRPVPHPIDSAKMVPSPLPDMSRPGLIPPKIVREVIICRDADGDAPIGNALVERAARRFHAIGLEVKIATPPTDSDFNDLLLAGVSMEASRGY